MPCTQCDTYAINQPFHGRDARDPDLCDVCFGRKRAELFNERDWQRYQWLRQQFRIVDWQPDGTYVPVFPPCLVAARSLDESIDLTRLQDKHETRD